MTSSHYEAQLSPTRQVVLDVLATVRHDSGARNFLVMDENRCAEVAGPECDLQR